MSQKRTSISVPEMGTWLGLGKTESYLVVKKFGLETVKVGVGRRKITRVLLDSFEKWYAGQDHYKKVSDYCPVGVSYSHSDSIPTPAQDKLREVFGDTIVYTVEEAKLFLTIRKTSMYELVGSRLFPSVRVNNQIYIPAASFHQWAEHQLLFTLSNDYDAKKKLMKQFKEHFYAQTKDVDEAFLAGLSEAEGVEVAACNAENFGKVASISDDSTEAASVVPDPTGNSTEAIIARMTEAAPPEKLYYQMSEVVSILGCSMSHVHKLTMEGKLRSKKLGYRKFIFRDSLEEYIAGGGK